MKKTKLILAGILSTVLAASAAMVHAAAATVVRGYRGDVNCDGQVTVVDIIKLQKNLLALDTLKNETAARFADMNDDGIVGAYDLAMLKRSVFTNQWFALTEEIPDTDLTEPVTTEWVEPSTDDVEPPTEYTEPTEVTEPEPTTEYTEPTTEPTEPSTEAGWNEAVIAAVDASLPTQGNANLVIFYVDFPDCRYGTDLTAEQIAEIAFGAEDTSDMNYPFDSMSAFYARSSKGAMQLGGTVLRYTTKENRFAYDDDKVKLAEECYDAFRDSVDFSQFDGDGDGMIDATLFSVPTSAGDDYWWPCAGGFGDPEYRVDGMAIGHIITGNAQIMSATDYKNFNSSYLHEMGHCMGLPDYYLYSSDDYEGFHGSAGTELMDADAYSDFGCFSKLMLGWYKQDQVSVYDASQGSQTFLLNNAQTADGNCVIIPYGKLDGRYFSEYFILEYITDDANNSAINRDMGWWQQVDDGIRIYHVNAALQEDYWWTYLKYQNGSEYTGGNDAGIRLLRLVGDGEGVFTTGDVINSSTSGFGWYDAGENEAIDPGVTITIGEFVNGQYSVTISN